MVSFTPTDDQKLLIETINRYALNDVRASAHEHDEASEPDANVIDIGWKMGIVPSNIPEELGGFGDLSAVTGVMAAEELAFGELSVAMNVLTPALFAYPVVLFGTAEQRESLLEQFLEEDLALATAAFLEPSITFDPNAMKTSVSTGGDAVVISGTKAFVPLAEDAKMMLVYARNSESGTTEAFIVDSDADGVQIEKRELLMGVRALPTYRVNFNEVRLPTSARLGGAVGIDFQVIVNRMNVALAGMAVGVARASYEYAKEYAKQRVQFGKPIAQNQSIAFMLADMSVEIDGARLMALEAAWKLDNGEDATQAAYLARQYANKMALTVTDGGVQTLGGYGFIREYPAERWLRNARGFTAFDGLAMV